MTSLPSPHRHPLRTAARTSRDARRDARPGIVVAARAAIGRAIRTGRTPLVSELATTVGVSSRTLERHVNRCVGRTVRDLIAQARLERALLLVQTTDMPLAQVAAAVGLQSQSRLNELFQRLLRQTPGAFRAASAGIAPCPAGGTAGRARRGSRGRRAASGPHARHR